MKTYTTSQGDMWDMIAHKTLGSISLTDKLMMANRRYLNFYTFPAGIVLTLPEVKNESSIEGLPPWKR
ncbi:tail protein X [Acutalibacter sp.]|uniref:tail protein X n=1 Tax=Acutalibacter sp. TaxID=1918636 RepID=UPI00216BFA2B|nr:phage tail protein [Acutalibacter sp.]